MFNQSLNEYSTTSYVTCISYLFKQKILYASTNFTYFCIAICIVCSVHAQIKKGAVLLGGELGFSTSTSTRDQANPAVQDTKSTAVVFSPAIGKAVKENLVVGVDLSLSYSKNQNIYSVEQKAYLYGAGFFVRRYKELGKGFYLFGQAWAGGYYNHQKDGDPSQPQSYTLNKGFTIQVGLYPGIAYSLSNKFQLETGFNNLAFVQFTHSDNTISPYTGEHTVLNGFSLGSSLSNAAALTIGFRYLIN